MRTKQDLGGKKTKTKNGKESVSIGSREAHSIGDSAEEKSGHTGEQTKTDHHGRSRGLNKYLLNECVNESDQPQQRFLDRQGDHEKKML